MTDSVGRGDQEVEGLSKQEKGLMDMDTVWGLQ